MAAAVGDIVAAAASSPSEPFIGANISQGILVPVKVEVKKEPTQVNSPVTPIKSQSVSPHISPNVSKTVSPYASKTISPVSMLPLAESQEIPPAPVVIKSEPTPSVCVVKQEQNMETVCAVKQGKQKRVKANKAKPVTPKPLRKPSAVPAPISLESMDLTKVVDELRSEMDSARYERATGLLDELFDIDRQGTTIFYRFIMHSRQHYSCEDGRSLF